MDANLQNDIKSRMDKCIDSLKGEFTKLRTGRASLALLDGVRVDCYGSMMPLNQLATVSVSDSRTLVISPWDKSTFQDIEKAIHKADLGLTPVNDGKVVRINIPALTEERRKDLVKLAKKFAEETRVAIRNVRRDGNDAVKKAAKDMNLPEDDLKKWEGDVQKLTDQMITMVDSLVTHKEKEILEI